MKFEQVAEIIKEELNSAIPELQNAGEQLDRFLAEIKTDVEKSLAIGDVTLLKYLRAGIIARLSRVSLGPVHRYRQRVADVVVTVIRVIIRLSHDKV